MNCPSCSGEASYIEEHSRWYCYSCEEYLEEGLPGPETAPAPTGVMVIESRKIAYSVGLIVVGFLALLTLTMEPYLLMITLLTRFIMFIACLISAILFLLPVRLIVDPAGISVNSSRPTVGQGSQYTLPWNTIHMITSKSGLYRTITLTSTLGDQVISEKDFKTGELKKILKFVREEYIPYYRHIQFHDTLGWSYK